MVMPWRRRSGSQVVLTRNLSVISIFGTPQIFEPIMHSFSETLLVGILIDSPIHRLRGMPHLYLQNSRCEVCKLGESRLGHVDVPRSFGAPGARINDSNKNAFSGSVAHYDNGISEISWCVPPITLPTFKELEALGFRQPPIQGEGACKRIILSSVLHLDPITLAVLSFYLTVGAHTGFFQQLGLRRSFPVYLKPEPVKISRNWVTSAYQVVVTVSDFPNPLRPFKTVFIIPVTFFGIVSCKGCGVAALTLFGRAPCEE